MTKNTTEWLTDRIDAIHRHGVTASEYWTLLDDCKAELAKQAERVAALEGLLARWRSIHEANDSQDFEPPFQVSQVINELAAVLSDSTDHIRDQPNNDAL